MTLLNHIPDSEWFFCFPMSLAVYCITALGIIHPLFWISVMRVYRSELFVFMYVLIGFWSFLSIALLYAILEESSCIYVFWIWYTLAFGATMAGLMFLLFCGFCVLGMRRKSIVALVGLIYYLVTIYFVVIVNKQRKEVFGLHAYCGGPRNPYPYARQRNVLTDSPTPSSMYTVRPTMRMEPLPPGFRYIPIATAPPIAAGPAVTMTAAFSTIIAAPPALPYPPAPPAPAYPPPPAPPAPPPQQYIAAAPMQFAPPAPQPAMAALRASDGQMQTTELPLPRATQPPYQNNALEAQTPGTTIDRQAAIARLSELLINSNECRKPRKPAHGRFQISGKRGATIKLTLHCDPGYRESSVVTQCKYNWWDRPIPQCRKRKGPGALPLPGGGCIMPGYPAHGEYRVADHALARPGDRVTGDNVVLLVSCDQPYRPVDPYVICVEGRWRHAPPTCSKHCKLVMDPTVEYKCFKAFKDEFLACSTWQPEGAVVAAACKPGHAHRGPFKYMRCRGESWDHVVSCLPNANFTSRVTASGGGQVF